MWSALRASMLTYVPLTTGMAMFYTAGSCLGESLYSEKSWKSSGLGGAFAGAFAAGLTRKSPGAAFSGFVLGSAAGAMPFWFRAMEPSIDDVVEATHPRTPHTFTGNDVAPARAASAYTQRLR